MTIVAIPSQAIAIGQTLTTPSVAVPQGVTSATARLDGTAWPAGAAVSIMIDLSDDNTIWTQVCAITPTKATLLAGFCSIGVSFAAAATSTFIRARIAVLPSSSAGITLVGTVTVV